MAQDPLDEPGPSSSGSSTRLTPGPSPYHESSQFRHWRYSPAQLDAIRLELNKKSVEVVTRNQDLERRAQAEIKHVPLAATAKITYLSMEDELLLLRYYCLQISSICRRGFGLPEVVEATAISYLKRFYLRNSVMEWHPKTIMPTCLFLAAKTTNFPVLIDQFIAKFSKLQPGDVLDTEFLVAQSLSFEFWIRGAEKGVRGWFLELQVRALIRLQLSDARLEVRKQVVKLEECPSTSMSTLQSSLPQALIHLAKSRYTDAEFIYTPSQIALACWSAADPSLIEAFLDWRYETLPSAYGMSRSTLTGIVGEIEALMQGVVVKDKEVVLDMKVVKEVDKRLRQCTNPEKTPGTALYKQRKQQKDADEAASRAAKSLKVAANLADREMVFGDVIKPSPSTSSNTAQATPGAASSSTHANGTIANGASVSASTNGILGKRKPLSPRVTVPSPSLSTASFNAKRSRLGDKGEDGPGKADLGTYEMDSGMGIKDEAMGMVIGGKGLKDVGSSLAEDD